MTEESQILRKGWIFKTNMTSALLFSDGGSRGNPGIAGAGFVLTQADGAVITQGCKKLGIATNNVAEYTALIFGIQAAQKNGVKNLRCMLDSELVVKQVNGEYKVKHPDMKPLFAEVQKLAANFDSISFEHIPREQNAVADSLANKAMDGS